MPDDKTIYTHVDGRSQSKSDWLKELKQDAWGPTSAESQFMAMVILKELRVDE